MTHDTEEAEVHSYLAAIEARLAHLPADQSEEIVFGVREHIAQAMERGGQSTGEVLAGLGTPDDIAGGLAAADAPVRGPGQPLPQPAPAPRHQSSTLWVVVSCILLPFGGFLAGIGWLFGVAGLWMGTRWKLWEKILGTCIVPGGTFGALALSRLVSWPGSPTAESGGSDPVLPGMPLAGTVALMAVPVLVAIYLLVAGLRRPSATPPSMRHN